MSVICTGTTPFPELEPAELPIAQAAPLALLGPFEAGQVVRCTYGNRLLPPVTGSIT